FSLSNFRRKTPPGRGSFHDSSPIHVVGSSGSTRYGNTFSGAASIQISFNSSPTFDLPFQTLEFVVPEFVEECAHVVEALGPRAVQPARALAALGHEPRLLEHAQVL